MRPWMLAMLGRKRINSNVSFQTSTTWKAPLTTEKVSITGKGAPGFPGETGDSTTAFGKVFPGGTGSFATAVTYNNIPVTPGMEYPLVIAGGGFVVINFDS